MRKSRRNCDESPAAEISLRVSPTANREIAEAATHVFQETDSAEHAGRLVRTIYELFDLLKRFPFMGQARPDLRKDLRIHPIAGYNVIYRVRHTQVEIAHVVHQRCDLRKLYSRKP